MTFADRISRNLDHRIDAACSARPPGMAWIGALGAGLGAGFGSLLGGSPLWAGVGGGTGVLLGYLVVWLRIRGSGLSLAMALALTDDRLELLRLNALGTRATGLIRAIPYAEISGVGATTRLLEIRVHVVARGGPLVVHTSKRGAGAGAEFVELLERRIGT